MRSLRRLQRKQFLNPLALHSQSARSQICSLPKPTCGCRRQAEINLVSSLLKKGHSKERNGQEGKAAWVLVQKMWPSGGTKNRSSLPEEGGLESVWRPVGFVPLRVLPPARPQRQEDRRCLPRSSKGWAALTRTGHQLIAPAC